jgi:hypothetical protein
MEYVVFECIYTYPNGQTGFQTADTFRTPLFAWGIRRELHQRIIIKATTSLSEGLAAKMVFLKELGQ